MKMTSLIRQLVLGLLIAGSCMLAGCGDLREDLPDCNLYVKFKYDYNMLSVDAFHTQVDIVDLYVFDKDGKFLFKQTGQGAPLALGNYLMEVVIPVGEYKFMAWAGAHDSYDITPLTPGVSDIKDLKLKLKRETSLIINKEIEPLWYGEIIDVKFTGKSHQTETINLIRDTNKLRFVFQGYSGWELNVNDYTYEIIEANGYLDYDNSVLLDNPLSYRPYYTHQQNPTLGVVELNTMRLMTDREARFVVTDKLTNNKVFDINLTDFLLMLQLQEHKWPDQEYLDREYEFKIVFFFDKPWNIIKIGIEINGWTYYLQIEQN